MADKGWIKLHRQLQDCCIWQKNEPFDSRSAWIDLLLSSTHKQKKMVVDNEVFLIERGSFMTSILKLSDKWKWSRGKVNRYLSFLESEHMIETKRTPKGTLVTIVKYEDFQGDYIRRGTTVGTTDSTTVGTADDTTHRTTVSTSVDTTVDTAVGTQNNNVKNIKNVNNDKNEKNVKKEKDITNVISQKKVYYPNDELLNDAFKEFLSMRNKIKKPLCTPRGITRIMNKINTLSGGDNDLAVKILNQSVDHCWQDVYELKTNDKQDRQGFGSGIDWSKV